MYYTRVKYKPHAKEQVLKGALIAAPLLSLPIAPSIVFGIHAMFVVFLVLSFIPASFAVGFYAIWGIGVIMEGAKTELIGDESFEIPHIYWPWGGYQRRLRFERRIRYLERECGVSDPWPL